MAGEFRRPKGNETKLDEPLFPYDGLPKQYGFLGEETIYTKEPTNLGVGSGRPQQYQVPNSGKPSIRFHNDYGDIENPTRIGRVRRELSRREFSKSVVNEN